MSILLTVTAKGQVTLRRSVLDHLGVRPGDKIAIDFLPSGRAQVSSARAPKSIDGLSAASLGPAPPRSRSTQ